MSVAQLRTDLAARAATLTVEAYANPPDSIDVPAVVVGPLTRVVYNWTAGPTSSLYEFPVRVYAARADAIEGVAAAEAFIVPSSLKAALENQATSNTGSAQWTNVRECSGVAVYDFAGVNYVGAEFAVEMVA